MQANKPFSVKCSGLHRDGQTDKPLRVLIGCETSGVMRRAFAALGHDAWSCDLLAAEDGSNRHIRGDVRDHLGDGWDLLIVAHPPCTRLCNSGVRWLHVPPRGRTVEEMWRELDEGAALFTACWQAPVPRIAVENPVMHRHARERLPADLPAPQIVQPWVVRRTRQEGDRLLPARPAKAGADQPPAPAGQGQRRGQALAGHPPRPARARALEVPQPHLRGHRRRLRRAMGRACRGGCLQRVEGNGGGERK